MPKDETQEEMVRVSYTCPPKYAKYVEAVAADEDRSMSSVFRRAVDLLAEEREEEIED